MKESLKIEVFEKKSEMKEYRTELDALRGGLWGGKKGGTSC